jgi:hypothetical protein
LNILKIVMAGLVPAIHTRLMALKTRGGGVADLHQPSVSMGRRDKPGDDDLKWVIESST